MSDRGNPGDAVLLCIHIVGDEISEKKCCLEWVGVQLILLLGFQFTIQRVFFVLFLF
jgi:hypothetical protein